jgi:hypothetical protein
VVCVCRLRDSCSWQMLLLLLPLLPLLLLLG